MCCSITLGFATMEPQKLCKYFSRQDPQMEVAKTLLKGLSGAAILSYWSGTPDTTKKFINIET
jgi:hypothetical protein